MATCGYNWKSQPIPSNPSENPDPALLTYPDSTSGYLINCANVLGVGSDPNVSEIKTIYYQACTASNNLDSNCTKVCSS